MEIVSKHKRTGMRVQLTASAAQSSIEIEQQRTLVSASLVDFTFAKRYERDFEVRKSE